MMDGTGQKDPLDPVDFTAGLLDWTKSVELEEAYQQHEAADQHKKSVDAVKGKNILRCCLEHCVIRVLSAKR